MTLSNLEASFLTGSHISPPFLHVAKPEKQNQKWFRPKPFLVSQMMMRRDTEKDVSSRGCEIGGCATEPLTG